MKPLFITLLAFALSATTTDAHESVGKIYARQTSSASPAIHTVTVGQAGNYQYYPNVTYANPGDIITFEFFPTNHSVIRGEYTGWPGCGGNGCNPCVPYELYHPDEVGFFSKNQKVASVTDASKTIWNLTINDTNPVWFYCDALNSCHPNGMNSSVHIDTQHDAAVNAAYELAPGQQWPAEGSDTSSGSGGSSKKTSSLSGGAIAGIVIGAVAGIAVLAALLYYMGRSHAYGRMFKHGVAPSQMGTSQAPLSEVGETSTEVRHF
ncbi:hypothetical protein K490DRAFT_67963 [Saccharata proteae CBS 121410]|uniref:Cupredoxin n=1 Tax=Saccharata proteae CBS 121410 TaxID=1314787 RepID=A0A9P4HR21_9PEZI|nr:hypothetical protein K490DRAFT_67963 [Saccharata proteae CBS 121410]